MNSGRSLDRLVNFTDAVVAVAITLLGLSLVDIRATGDEQTVWRIIADHTPELVTFAFTFVVVAALWQVHNRIFNRLRGFDDAIFRWNVLWLLAIVILPWPSVLYSEGIGIGSTDFSGGVGGGGAGLFYWGTLAFVSFITAAVGAHLARHPELIDPANAEPRRHPMRSLAFGATFLGIGVVSLVAPAPASWLALLLIPLDRLFAHLERSDPASAER